MSNKTPTRKNTDDPVTALPSSLLRRSTPTVPPAEVLYEPLLKPVLARRFVYDVLSVSAAASWFFAVVWTSWQRGGLRSLGFFGGIINWLSPLTLFSVVVWWSLACAPIAVLRKLFLQATYSPSLSPRQSLLRHATERRYQCALLVTLASSVSLALFHALVAQTVERHRNGDPKLGLWAGSRKHPFHLNGRFCFIFLVQINCALFYWVRDVLKNRLAVRWSRESNVLVQMHPILPSLVSILMLSTASLVTSLLVFGVSRSIVLPALYRVPIIHGFLRPFVAHFLRPTFTITFLWSNFGLVIRAFFLTLSTHVLWDIPSTIFDTVFSVPIEVTEACKDPGLILLSGINSADTYFQLQAFHDLTVICSNGDRTVAKRALIYNDSKHSPTLWSTLVRRGLLLLGSDYQHFIRRGNPPPPVKVRETPAPKPVTITPQTPIIHAQIYKPAQLTPIDRIVETLASDSPTAAALEKSGGDSIELPKFLTGTLRSQINADQISSLASGLSKSLRSTVTCISHRVPRRWLPLRDVDSWWTRERRNRAAHKALPNRELDIMIVEVLSKMVGYSLREDVLGYVQRDIPCILEAFVSFLLETEEYQKELAKFVHEKESSDQVEILRLREEADQASEWIEEMSGALRTGIALIINVFEERLTKFRFPPRIAPKLQMFADYRP